LIAPGLACPKKPLETFARRAVSSGYDSQNNLRHFYRGHPRSAKTCYLAEVIGKRLANFPSPRPAGFGCRRLARGSGGANLQRACLARAGADRVHSMAFHLGGNFDKRARQVPVGDVLRADVRCGCR